MSSILRIPMDHQMSRRAEWLIGLRWLALSVAAVAALVGNTVLDLALPTAAIWATLVAIAAYNLIFWTITRRAEQNRTTPHAYATMLRVQLVADVAALTLLLHFSGGIENPFSVYYLLLIVAASIVMSKQESLLYAGIVTASWAGLLLLEATAVIPHHNLRGFRLPFRYQEWGHIISEILVLATAGLAISYLASTIIERLRQREQQLFEANQSCEIRAEELADLNARLKEMDTTRSMFIRLVTHELRAPVAAIQSYLRLILDGYVPEERVEEIVAKAEQRANDQLDLIGDLLDLAHLREPGRKKAVAPCDATGILEDVLDMLQARIEDKQLQCTVHIDHDLSPVLADEEHVKRIWTNLVSNAVKYTPEEGEIEIRAETKDGELFGSVRDSGIGISPDEQEHIFEDFYRTEKAKSMSRHGTGLGLSIVKGILDLYSGTIEIDSVEGQGSTFTFTLPLADASDADFPQGESAPTG